MHPQVVVSKDPSVCWVIRAFLYPKHTPVAPDCDGRAGGPAEVVPLDSSVFVGAPPLRRLLQFRKDNDSKNILNLGLVASSLK